MNAADLIPRLTRPAQVFDRPVSPNDADIEVCIGDDYTLAVRVVSATEMPCEVRELLPSGQWGERCACPDEETAVLAVNRLLVRRLGY